MKTLVCHKVHDAGFALLGVVCDSAIVRARDPFFVPDGGEWRGMTLRGIRIDRLGKGVAEAFSDRYYGECVTAVHTFATDDVSPLRWCRDGALIVSEPVACDDFDGDLRDTFGRLIAMVSEAVTLKTGDLVLLAETDGTFNIGPPPQNVEIGANGPFPPMRLKIR